MQAIHIKEKTINVTHHLVWCHYIEFLSAPPTLTDSSARDVVVFWDYEQDGATTGTGCVPAQWPMSL